MYMYLCGTDFFYHVSDKYCPRLISQTCLIMPKHNSFMLTFFWVTFIKELRILQHRSIDDKHFDLNAYTLLF